MYTLATSENQTIGEHNWTSCLRVLLVDDHPLALVGIRKALTQVNGLEVVAECDRGEQALQTAIRLKPDLMILDVHVPGLACEQVILHSRLHHPTVKILILSASEEDSQLRRFADLPIDGYILKEEAPVSLCQAVRVIQQGATWFSHSVAKRLLILQQAKPAADLFTARERQIMAPLQQGHSNKVIARLLNLAHQTVSNTISSIYQKMEVSNRVSAIVWLRNHPEHQRGAQPAPAFN